MAERSFAGSDAALEDALRDLAGALVVPSPGPAGSDLAGRVRAALEAAPPPAPAPWWHRLVGPRPRSLRASIVLALVALAILAALAGAAILGVPGIRLAMLGGAAPTLPPSPSVRPSLDLPVGSGLGLGVLVELDETAGMVGFDPALPEAFSPPDAAWVGGRRLSLVWESEAGLPPIAIPGAGLLVTQFEGRVGEEYIEKSIHGGTTVERVDVAGHAGFWLSGAPHVLFYVDKDGRFVEEGRRIVADTLLWEVDGVTFRIESALGRAATIALAEGLATGG
jgi:hypothetical protein